MFSYQIHTILFIHNWSYKKYVVWKVDFKIENMKKLWFPIPIEL
jgi:hypothetical protein